MVMALLMLLNRVMKIKTETVLMMKKTLQIQIHVFQTLTLEIAIKTVMDLQTIKKLLPVQTPQMPPLMEMVIRTEMKFRREQIH